MKKVISFVLALVMLLSTGVICVNAASITAEEKLASIQKMEGFIPGKTSNPSNNCFQFVSNVCEKLFGVTYYYERLHDNFIADHDSGKYYTVGTLIIKNSTINSDDAKKIKDFFVNNARAGDVVHYGGYQQGSTHTFMVQHIDSQKMQIYHSNYGFANYSSTQCHIDTILWANFLKTPMQSDYDANKNCISVNSIFYNKMKSQGLGISINRYSGYDKMFATAPTTAETTTQQTTTQQEPIVPAVVTGLATTKVCKDSISIQWDAVENAESYYVAVKNNTQKTTFGKAVTTTSTSLNNLTDKNEYEICVIAISSTDTKSEPSEAIKVIAKNTTPKVNNLSLVSRTTSSLSIKWDAVKNAEKYYIYIKNETKNTEFNKEVKETSTTLNNFTAGNTYSVKVKACVKGSYGSYSSVLKTSTKPNKPKISSVTSKNKSITVNWKAVKDTASGYRISISTDKNFKKNVKNVNVSGRKTVTKSIKGLKKGSTYYVKIRSYKTVDSTKVYSSYSAVSSIKCR